MNYRLYGTIVFLLVFAIVVNQSAESLSYDATNVTTRVNITQAYPEILAISMPSSYDLIEGTTKSIFCNITVRDYNGYNDLALINATLYDNTTSTPTGADDNNSHYTNTSCSFETNTDPYTGVWSCAFDVQYFANNGTWGCYSIVQDNYGFEDNGTNYSTINPLYALNVTSLIDYGNMAVGDTSGTSETANVTNFGNMDINISVYGFGGDDFATGNTLAFICDVGNISVENERYSATDQAWGAMTALSNTSAIIPTLKILQQTNDATPVTNQTFWRLYVPPNPFGQCNGTVVFEAEAP